MTITTISGVVIEERVGLLDSYIASQDLLGGGRDGRRSRVRAAERFVAEHPNVADWMALPVHVRLTDLAAAHGLWPFVSFALITRRVSADAEFLLAKNFGHSVGQWVTGLYPAETTRLFDAADRIGTPRQQAKQFISEGLGFVIAFTGRDPGDLTSGDLDRCVTAIKTSPVISAAMQHHRGSHMFGLRKLLFEAGLTDCPPARRRVGGPLTRQQRLATTVAPEIRSALIEYLDARSAVLRPKSITKMTSALAIFGEFLTEQFPDVTTIASIERRHVQAFLTWTATRESRNYNQGVVGPFVTAHAAIVLRGFFDDITEWGWPQAPTRRLMFTSDIPKQPKMVPRALGPDVDTALMTAVAGLDDLFARVGLTVLRGTGLRVGELLELELDAVVDFGPAGTWLRVPLGKLNSERMVPLNAATIAVLDEWFAHRRQQRAMPHPRDGRPTDFVFVEHGRHLGPRRLQDGLRDAARAAGLVSLGGTPVRIVAHQLRHTYATTLVNAGMSLQALMSLLGHTSPEMTIRYAQLASPTIRTAYDQAIGKLRRRIPVAPVVAGKVIPNDVEWLRSEMLKTRVAHGYCSRDLAAEACAYANICETCPNFTTTPEFLPAITAQLDDLRHLRDDAHERGWTSEVARHQRVIDSLEQHHRRHSNELPDPAIP